MTLFVIRYLSLRLPYRRRAKDSTLDAEIDALVARYKANPFWVVLFRARVAERRFLEIL